MIEALKLWNEPNDLSHWDFHLDPTWREFSQMTCLAAAAVRQLCPELPLILGGMSPIDSNFISLIKSHGVLEHLDAVAVHGFSLDWVLPPQHPNHHPSCANAAPSQRLVL